MVLKLFLKFGLRFHGGCLDLAVIWHHIVVYGNILRIEARFLNRVFFLFALPTFLPACRTVPPRDAAAKRETADGVSVVAVQYDASMSWPFSNFTDPSHFMV